jgi:hypothetical protein
MTYSTFGETQAKIQEASHPNILMIRFFQEQKLLSDRYTETIEIYAINQL